MRHQAKIALLLPGDAAREARKAARRSLGHHAAVLESAAITQAQWQLMNQQEQAKIDVRQIIRALNEKKIRFVLTGAHAIGGWTGRPRATVDVDILVKGGRTQARAVKALQALYPHLEVRDFHGVSAFFVPGTTQSVIDVTYPHRADIEETLAHPIWISKDGLKYRIPSLEAALANKFGAMLSLSRDVKKRAQDAIDFSWMVTHSLDAGQQPIDVERLRLLGEKVSPGNGGEDVLRLVEQVKQSGMVDLAGLFKRS